MAVLLGQQIYIEITVKRWMSICHIVRAVDNKET